MLEKSTKTGLENIRKRYQYLTKTKIDIVSDEQSFAVGIPLLKVFQEKNQVLVP